MAATPYPTLSPEIFQDPVDAIQYTNDVLKIGGFEYSFGFGMLIAVFLIAFLNSQGYTFRERLLFSSFVSMISSVLLAGVGVLKADFVGIMLVITALFYVLVWLQNRG